MKPINEYITERIRIDNTRRPEFPINGTVDEQIEYLRHCGFEKIPALDNPIYTMNNQKGRKVVWNLGSMLRFADVTKRQISEKNPALCCNPSSKYYALEYSDSSSKNSYKLLTKDEFLRAMWDILRI